MLMMDSGAEPSPIPRSAPIRGTQPYDSHDGRPQHPLYCHDSPFIHLRAVLLTFPFLYLLIDSSIRSHPAPHSIGTQVHHSPTALQPALSSTPILLLTKIHRRPEDQWKTPVEVTLWSATSVDCLSRTPSHQITDRHTRHLVPWVPFALLSCEFLVWQIETTGY